MGGALGGADALAVRARGATIVGGPVAGARASRGTIGPAMRYPDTLRALVAAAALVGLALFTPPASGQSTWGGGYVSYAGYGVQFPLPPGFEQRVQSYPLGPGLAAEKTFACGTRAYPTRQCSLLGWRPRGFVFGSRPDLARALAFSGDGHGRVIASTDRDVIVSDDRGQSWQRAEWNGVARPQIIAMDPETRSGVAAAEGAIHVTDDAGASWHFVREIPSRRVVQVVVAGRNAMLTDGNGGLWALIAGSEFTVLSESGSQASVAGLPQFTVEAGAITARDAEGQWVRLGPRGTVDRSAPSARWGR
jgi:hypothetical protein